MMRVVIRRFHLSERRTLYCGVGFHASNLSHLKEQSEKSNGLSGGFNPGGVSRPSELSTGAFHPACIGASADILYPIVVQNSFNLSNLDPCRACSIPPGSSELRSMSHTLLMIPCSDWSVKQVRLSLHLLTSARS